MELEGVDPTALVAEHTNAIERILTTLPPRSALAFLSFVRGRMDAVEARLLAERYESGSSDRGVEELLRQDGRTSKAQANKRALRGKATNANPDIANRIASGNLSSEQADVIANAAEQTDGQAACDTELIDAIASTTPEQGKKKATSFVNERLDTNAVQTRHDRQRRRRGWYRHRLSNGNSALTFHGDDESIDDIERNVRARADAEYTRDGGRDRPSAKHPRTTDQRGFDAAHALITGPQDTGTQSGRQTSRTRSGRKATIFVAATVDQVAGNGIGRGERVFTDPNGGPLPTTLVEELACGSEFIAQLFSTPGELLWQGRQTRFATAAQITGLIGRDGGCVLCRASHDRCVAHHLVPWEAPRHGPTDIDNLALVCEDCHHRLHQRKQTLIYDRAAQIWILRAATWDEIPPDNYRMERVKTRHEPERTKPHLYEHRQNVRRHDPHGDQLV